MSSDSLLWTPDARRVAQTHLVQFSHELDQKVEPGPGGYQQLHQWSIDHKTQFWKEVWRYAGVISSDQGNRVLIRESEMPGAQWFPDARLNYAQNLLRRSDAAPALIFRGENGDERVLSHAELVVQVHAIASGLRALGVRSGDRVAGYLPNLPEAIIAMLAATSLGAVWSSCSPDFGINGVRDRFGQIQPSVLFTADGYHYAGKQFSSLDTVSELVDALPHLKAVVVVDFTGAGQVLSGKARSLRVDYTQWLDQYGVQAISHTDLYFEQLPFNHPLYILFSSGTTGKPKCIVHGAGGTLLQHMKEHLFHCDIHRDDRLFFFTTCGWMMWNWLASALAAEATLMLYDGSPFYPDGNVLFDYAQAHGVSHFGTSAKFIDACSKAGISPKSTHRLPNLRSVLSTGSPLVPESFDYVYEHIADDVCLSSMSGGTDIISCFILGNPCAPVYRGELQCKGLGMDVQVFSDDGQPLGTGSKGELVCASPFPSMPVGFYGDTDGKRYHAAYFENFPNVWCHGDYVAVTEHGGMVIYGRSDAVLNPGGVRIGTAEIYRQVETFDEVVESLVIGQQWKGDVRVILFVRLREEQTLDEDLCTRVMAHIREQTTPRHVPARMIQVADIPRTRSGKIVELAVRKVVHGESIDNIEALANPEALELYRDLPELQS